MSQYGHSIPNEVVDSAYEGWAASRTASFDCGNFESAIQLDQLVTRTPYTAAKRVSKATAKGQGAILSALDMDSMQSNRSDPAFLASVGASLNLGVNELADVLHTFYRNVVAEDDRD